MFSLISLSQIGYIYIDKKFPSEQILYIDCIYDSFLLILNNYHSEKGEKEGINLDHQKHERENFREEEERKKGKGR